MLDFLQELKNWEDVEKELSLKGVKAMTFFDVVMDYILMDAFDDLDNPPSSVTAVIQNRWLSNGFKETVSLLLSQALSFNLHSLISKYAQCLSITGTSYSSLVCFES